VFPGSITTSLDVTVDPATRPGLHPVLLPVIAASLALAAHAAVLGGWQVDDAGITYAYARNLAAGSGVVSQPGAPPVEGYSNPLWMLLIALSWAARTFSVAWTPKLLAFVFDVVVLVVVARDLAGRGSSRWTIAVTLLVLAACTPFVIWTFSGLENPFLAALVVLLTASARVASRGPSCAARDYGLGVLAALVALTRPDGLIYAGLLAAAAVAGEWQSGAGAAGRVMVRLWRGAIGFVPPFAGYIAFRLSYFADWAPNTMRAKYGVSASSVLAPGKLGSLLEAAAGDAGWLAAAGAVGIIVWLARRQRLPRDTLMLAGCTGAAAAAFLILPNDWMGEFRFATPFFPLACWLAADLATASSPVMSARVRQAAAAAA
jgi:hypothetical protein